MTLFVDKPPFFSIVIPTFNRVNRLRNALNSILAQELQDYEVLVVDDGSTDNTKELVLEISNKNPAVRYFYKKNEERSIARNYGIERALGNYIGFLDSDDTLYTNHLSTAFSLLQRNNFPAVGHLGFELKNVSGNQISVTNNLDDSFKEKLIHENILHGNAIFIRNDVLKEIKFIPHSAAFLSEDWYLWLRLASRYKFYFDNTITSTVINHSERSLNNINTDKLIVCTNLIVEYLKKDTFFLQTYGKMVNYHFANHYTFLTLNLALQKRRTETLKYMALAFNYDYTVVFRKRFLASVKYLLK